MNFTLRNLPADCLIVLAAVVFSSSASAASMQQALAQCKEQVRPTVRDCVIQKMGGQRGDPSPHLASCKAAVTPQVKACVARLIGAASLQSNPLDAAAGRGQDASKGAIAAGQKRVAAPRTIADITAILDQEKPDPVRLKKLHEAADASPPNSDAVTAAKFYYGRSLVRAELGRTDEAVADGERAIQLGSGKVDQLVLSSFRQTVALHHLATGQPKLALALFLKMAEDGERGERGWLFNGYRQIASIYLALGDLDRAQAYVAKQQALWKHGSSIRGYDSHAKAWESNVEDAKAMLAEARGQFEEAVRDFQRAEMLRRAGAEAAARAVIATPRAKTEQAADSILASAARVKSKLGRVAEAEIDLRRALLNRLKATGKYNPQTANFIAALGTLLIDQGRYEEARKLINATLGIYRELGVAEHSQTFVNELSHLASVEALEGRWVDAQTSFAAVERATEKWEPARRNPFLMNLGRIETMYHNGRVDDGLTVGRQLLEFRVGRYGDNNPDTALARGQYAVGLALAKRDSEALKQFQMSVPLLTATTFNTDSDDVLNAATRTRYTQIIVENYIALLGRLGPAAGPDAVGDTFRLADSIRGRAVQKALTSAGARTTASDPKLAAAVRQEQDLRQQIGTQLGQLNSLLALPAAERDDSGVAAMRKDIDKMRTEHLKVRADIDRRFPDYADLIDPRPPTLAQIRESLKPDETLLSFYFGRDASFVWAVSQDGKIEFAALRKSASAIEETIKKLREALEPQAAMVSDIPAFDLARSYELYETLLEPVKAGWGKAKSLIVVTNGALGLLPLGVLITAPYEAPKDGPIFAGYRGAPWLSRTHAITMVPSAAALRTLRRLPPGSSKRDKLIAFGDPWFHPKHASDAGAQLAAVDVQTRGVPLKRRAGPPQGADSAGLGDLPRLPDTADELRSIAIALEADPTKALHLGKEANEDLVKKTDLSGFKIIAFATHGLVPGEIDGLDQPALALSAPDVAGVNGDGLLTMQEILSLKLDADWVVLSACNTGAGAGAGAEAASGLGRAFFYAGTRAILVTNWSVHSQSARELVTDLFRRQAADAKLSRGEALRQAMMALIDGKGFSDETGETVFAYAHPLFWAPYTIIGDGG